MREYYNKYWSLGLSNTDYHWTECFKQKKFKIIEKYASGHVVDYGCGNGVYTKAISILPHVIKVLGLDISSEAIKIAKQRYPSIDFRLMDNFFGSSFDFLVCTEVLEHIIDLDKTFRDFSNMLQPCGLLFISTTEFNFLKKLAMAFVWERNFRPDNPHIRFFTKQSLETLLDKYGFDVIGHWWNESYFGIMPKGQIVLARKRGEICNGSTDLENIGIKVEPMNA